MHGGSRFILAISLITFDLEFVLLLQKKKVHSIFFHSIQLSVMASLFGMRSQQQSTGASASGTTPGASTHTSTSASNVAGPFTRTTTQFPCPLTTQPIQARRQRQWPQDRVATPDPAISARSRRNPSPRHSWMVGWLVGWLVG